MVVICDTSHRSVVRLCVFCALLEQRLFQSFGNRIYFLVACKKRRRRNHSSCKHLQLTKLNRDHKCQSPKEFVRRIRQIVIGGTENGLCGNLLRKPYEFLVTTTLRRRVSGHCAHYRAIFSHARADVHTSRLSKHRAILAWVRLLFDECHDNLLDRNSGLVERFAPLGSSRWRVRRTVSANN